MGYVSGARLVSATSNAGGLGMIASATMSLAELENAIGDDRPNRRAVRREPARRRARRRRARRLIIAGRVPVASFALAPKPELIAALKDAGVITIASVGARRHAEKVAGWGIDAVIATGGEGGGHVGAVPTSLLIPQVAAAVDIPVIAAGGFFDGRGLVAALAYGAAGIAMGTRFLLTRTARSPTRSSRSTWRPAWTARWSPPGSTGCRTEFCGRRWSTVWSGRGGRAGAAAGRRATPPRSAACAG